MRYGPPCIDWAEKLALRSDELSPSERAALNKHIMTCRACAAAAADYAVLKARIRSLTPPAVRPSAPFVQVFAAGHEEKSGATRAKTLRTQAPSHVPRHFKPGAAAANGLSRPSMKGTLIGVVLALMLSASLVFMHFVYYSHGSSSSLKRVHTHAAANSPAWSPDELQIASPSVGQAVQIWSTITGRHFFAFHGYPGTVSAVAWSPDGTRIASASADQTVQVWDARTGAHLLTYYGHTGAVLALAWSPDGTHIASAGADQTVQVWDTWTGIHLLTYHGHTDVVSAVAWSPDGKRIASASADQTVQVWNAQTGVAYLIYHGHTGPVLALAWSPDGARIASAGADQTVQVWDARTGARLLTYHGHSGTVFTVAWSPDGLQIASEGTDQTVQVWDVITGELSHLFMLVQYPQSGS